MNKKRMLQAMVFSTLMAPLLYAINTSSVILSTGCNAMNSTGTIPTILGVGVMLFLLTEDME